jgi:hypothetical protein
MKKNIIIIIKIAILVLLFCWIVIVFTDYFRVRQDKSPMFCISEQDIEYDDGSVHICTGIGYKTIRYNRSCISAAEFGSITLKERTC